MAEEMLVNKNLSEEMILSGKKLIQILDKAEFGVTAAFWLFLSDNGRWFLIIALADVNLLGPKNAYKKMDQIISINQDVNLTIFNIQILDKTDVLISLLKTAIKTSNAITGIRFTDTSIAGLYIDDAYIYRLT